MPSFTVAMEGDKDASQAIVMSVTFSDRFLALSFFLLAEGPDVQERDLDCKLNVCHKRSRKPTVCLKIPNRKQNVEMRKISSMSS